MLNLFYKFTKNTSILLMLVIASLSLNLAQAADKEAPVKVCAVPQLYNALNFLNRQDPKVTLYFATANEIYALASNHEGICDVILSSDERLPITLIRAQKAVASSLLPFARVPLVFWTKDAKLIATKQPLDKLIRNQKVKSLAIAKANLTPVGFASNEVLKQPSLNLAYLKNNTYKSDQEYQVYSMVEQGNVEVGLISYPLVASIEQKDNGLIYLVPRHMYPDIQYYAVIMTKSKDHQPSRDFIKRLISDPKTQDKLQAFGFYPLTPDD